MFKNKTKIIHNKLVFNSKKLFKIPTFENTLRLIIFKNIFNTYIKKYLNTHTHYIGTYINLLFYKMYTLS